MQQTPPEKIMTPTVHMQVTSVQDLLFSPQSSFLSSRPDHCGTTTTAAMPARHAVPKSLAAFLRLASTFVFRSPHCLSFVVVVRCDLNKTRTIILTARARCVCRLSCDVEDVYIERYMHTELMLSGRESSNDRMCRRPTAGLRGPGGRIHVLMMYL